MRDRSGDREQLSYQLNAASYKELSISACHYFCFNHGEALTDFAVEQVGVCWYILIHIDVYCMRHYGCSLRLRRLLQHRAPDQLSHPHWGAGRTGRCCTYQAAFWSGGTSSESAEPNVKDLLMQSPVPCSQESLSGIILNKRRLLFPRLSGGI